MHSLDTHIRAAEGFLELGLPRQALAELEGMELAAWRADARTLELRAWSLRALADWEQMETVCRQLCARAQVNGRWRKLLALAVQRGQWDHGLPGLRVQAAMFKPEDPGAYLVLAVHELGLGHPGRAAARLAQAIRLCPAYADLARSSAELAVLLSPSVQGDRPGAP